MEVDQRDKCAKRIQISDAASFRKRTPMRPLPQKHDLYVSAKRPLEPQLRRARTLLLRDKLPFVIIHGLGAAIEKALTLALMLKNKLGGSDGTGDTVHLDVTTSSVALYDDVVATAKSKDSNTMKQAKDNDSKGEDDEDDEQEDDDDNDDDDVQVSTRTNSAVHIKVSFTDSASVIRPKQSQYNKQHSKQPQQPQQQQSSQRQQSSTPWLGKRQDRPQGNNALSGFHAEKRIKQNLKAHNTPDQ